MYEEEYPAASRRPCQHSIETDYEENLKMRGRNLEYGMWKLEFRIADLLWVGVAAAYKDATPLCHPERSEGSQMLPLVSCQAPSTISRLYGSTASLLTFLRSFAALRMTEGGFGCC